MFLGSVFGGNITERIFLSKERRHILFCEQAILISKSSSPSLGNFNGPALDNCLTGAINLVLPSPSGFTLHKNGSYESH